VSSRFIHVVSNGKISFGEEKSFVFLQKKAVMTWNHHVIATIHPEILLDFSKLVV
jgi:hypothetical protein